MAKKMNLFLTGDIQIGKTTVLNKTLHEILGRIGRPYSIEGCLTYSGPLKANGLGDVFIKAYGTPDACDDAHRLCERLSRTEKKPFPLVFESLGAGMLLSALRSKPDIIVIDELGILEEHCEAFKAAVFRCLDAKTTVIGVLRKADSPFLNDIRCRQDVEVFTITTENRDRIAPAIAEKIRSGSPLAIC